jgi:hypothetical protein
VQDSGERVSNTWVTCPGDWDNSSKGLLIPDDIDGIDLLIKALVLPDGPASH